MTDHRESFSCYNQKPVDRIGRDGSRLQPVASVNDKGELVWKFDVMPTWQALMFPLRYVGDFIAYWAKRKLFVETGIEGDETYINLDVKSNVPWQLEEKYDAIKKVKRGKGD